MGHRDRRHRRAFRHGVFLHYLCKYLDFADTLVIVLRKKAAQLSFLHLYHHASIVLVWGWVVATAERRRRRLGVLRVRARL